MIYNILNRYNYLTIYYSIVRQSCACISCTACICPLITWTCRWNVNMREQSTGLRRVPNGEFLPEGFSSSPHTLSYAQTGRRTQRCTFSKRPDDTRSTWQDDGRKRAYAEDRMERGVMLGSVQLSQQLRTSFYLSLLFARSPASFPPAPPAPPAPFASRRLSAA